jgi:hypothetical protein
MNVTSLFDGLWQDYTSRLAPSALRIHQLLTEDEPLINDHIALRTFNCEGIGLSSLAQHFLDLGYFEGGSYVFTGKKLQAKHFEHPDLTLPKVFISELEVEKCSQTLQGIIEKLVALLPAGFLQSPAALFSGRPWPLSFADYQTLAAESEYAAWLAAHGYGANHFTVSVNQLTQFAEVSEVNSFLARQGFSINAVGGEVKGGAEVYLAQSSTMADRVPVSFDDGVHDIPGGFYEFAKRYPLSSGQLYTGFVEASADKIFQSTDR